MGLYSREQLIEHASLTIEDLSKVRECRRVHNQLGFAYQVGFVRLLNRFPIQQPFEIIDELLTFTGVQLQTDPQCISEYATRRETVAEHQARIRQHLKLKSFGTEEEKQLEAFLYEECFRLEQTTALRSQAQQFLKQRRILQPATSTLDRLIGEQRTRSRAHTFERVFMLLSPEVRVTLDALLETKNGFVNLTSCRHKGTDSRTPLRRTPLPSTRGTIACATAGSSPLA